MLIVAEVKSYTNVDDSITLKVADGDKIFVASDANVRVWLPVVAIVLNLTNSSIEPVAELQTKSLMINS